MLIQTYGRTDADRITTANTELGPSHGHTGSAQEISCRLVQRFQRYARKQRDGQTDRQTNWSQYSIPIPGCSNNENTSKTQFCNSCSRGKNYVSKHGMHLLQLNVTAGRQRWTNYTWLILLQMFDNNCMLCVSQQLAYCVYLVALFHCLVFCRQCVCVLWTNKWCWRRTNQKQTKENWKTVVVP